MVTPMSESTKSTETTNDSLASLKSYFHHLREHVSEVPIRTKIFDPKCESCQRELKRIHKKSDNLPGIELNGKAQASVSFTSLLCHLQMHEECVQYYGMKNELVEFRCVCSCHDKPIKKQARKRISRSANKSIC